MKICYLANASSIHTQRWAKSFAERGHEVHIISFEQPNVELNNITIHIVKRYKKYFYISLFYKLLHFKRILYSIKPDIVHAHFLTKYGFIGAFLGFHPFVASSWGSDVYISKVRNYISPTYKKMLFSIYAPLALRYIAKVSDYSTAETLGTKKLMSEFGFKEDSIEVCVWGTNIDNYSPEKRSQFLRNVLGINELNNLLILSIRQLKMLYGIKDLIHAISILKPEYPFIKCIVGSDGPEKGNLQKLVEDLGLKENVIFTGYISDEELPTYIASSDIMVSTSFSDTISISILEGMSCGLPIVATDVGSTNEWVRNEENGFLVESGNAEMIADKLRILIENPTKRFEMGALNRKLIVEKADWNKSVIQMENIYYKLVDNNES